MTRYLSPPVGVVICVALLQVAHDEPVLDLSTFQPPSSRMAGGWGEGGGSSARAAPAVPIQIEILQFDKGRYAPGDEFVYEIRIRNISAREAIIPWDPDWTHFPYIPDVPPPVGYRTAYLALLEKRSDEKLKPFSQYRLFGSPGVKSSLLRLQPNETARIRGKGKWDSVPFLVNGEQKPHERITVLAVLRFSFGRPIDDIHALREFESKPVDVEFSPD